MHQITEKCVLILRHQIIVVLFLRWGHCGVSHGVGRIARGLAGPRHWWQVVGNQELLLRDESFDGIDCDGVWRLFPLVHRSSSKGMVTYSHIGRVAKIIRRIYRYLHNGLWRANRDRRLCTRCIVIVGFWLWLFARVSVVVSSSTTWVVIVARLCRLRSCAVALRRQLLFGYVLSTSPVIARTGLIGWTLLLLIGWTLLLLIVRHWLQRTIDLRAPDRRVSLYSIQDRILR